MKHNKCAKNKQNTVSRKNYL